MASHFVISLDFEQAWGMEARKAYGAERPAILGARDAIPRILELAERHGIACTWATVGLLFFDDRDELLAALPEKRPDYADPALSPYGRMAMVGRDERTDPLHFGRSLLRQIRDCPRQEVAGHTFSHYYALEDGGDPAAFTADLAAARLAAATLGITLRSIVFPRNQVRETYLPLCHAMGYRTYRGTQAAEMYRSRPRAAERVWSRLLRAADTYWPIATPREPNRPRPVGAMTDIAASRFLRPVRSSTALLNRAQLRRIEQEVTRAAQQDGVYHLWWHPQNFGRDTALNLAMLEAIFEHYRRLADTYGMASTTMIDLSTGGRDTHALDVLYA
jgi:hypothetical protein